jgi:hypothetical protein
VGRDRDMSNDTKTVRGGFRATLALIISIIALIIAIVAYQRSGEESYFEKRISDLQDTIKALKEETSEKVTKIRKETAKALEKVGIEIKREGSKQEQ